jgi:hypothetical protein
MSRVKTTDPLSSLQKPDGTYTQTKEESLIFLMDSLFIADDPSIDTPYQSQIRGQMALSLETYNDIPFTPAEVKNIMMQQNPQKTPGIDNFTADIIQTLFDTLPNVVTDLYNKCLELGYFPREWEQSKIHFIKKSKSRNASDPRSYRPLSLIPVLAKVFEKLIINRLNHHLCINNMLHNNQYGFRSQRSTEHALHHLINAIKRQLSENGYIIAVSLDIQGAFDSAGWPQILAQLRTKECPQNIYNVLRSYLSDRKIIISTNDGAITRPFNRGCPQGSALGPGLWVLLYDTLLQIEMPLGAEIIGFADDTMLVVRSHSIKRLEKITNEALTIIDNWGTVNKLKFNAEKTKAILFTRKLRYTEPHICLGNTNIPLSNSLKYLGLIIDKNLNWNEHINTNVTKVLNCANAFLRVARNTWGLSAENMRTIYIGAIEPMLLYGASVWGNVITKKYIIDKLRRVQRIFAIKAIKGYRTISYDAAVVIANLIPIELKIKELINIYKLKNSSGVIIESLHADLLQRPINTDMLHPATRPQITLTTEINTETNDIEIYTDGSKTDTNVGAGFTVMHNSIEIYSDRLRLAEYCSVFQSELIAILYSLMWITKNINQPQDIIIRSDSKSGISAISSIQTHNPIIH